jgi:hypothetical protein
MDLLHAVKLRHGTDGFNSPPKEGALRIFFALKIRRLRPGANPRTRVPKASTLPLDHRSRLDIRMFFTNFSWFELEPNTTVCTLLLFNWYWGTFCWVKCPVPEVDYSSVRQNDCVCDERTDVFIQYSVHSVTHILHILIPMNLMRGCCVLTLHTHKKKYHVSLLMPRAVRLFLVQKYGSPHSSRMLNAVYRFCSFLQQNNSVSKICCIMGNSLSLFLEQNGTHKDIGWASSQRRWTLQQVEYIIITAL